ncbi:MAG: small multi-drug export protein [Limnochordaceae bacterium]|nr:small multi-drug export protein [Limnochordaceae bacterium]
MGWNRWLLLVVLTWVPWLELRGTIPLGLAWGMPWLPVVLVVLVANVLLFWPTWLVMSLFYERWLQHTFVRDLLERARRRSEVAVERFGPIGLLLFVALPFPGTGAYTGTALAYLAGMPVMKAFRSVAAGVLVDGVIITLLSTGVITGVRWLSG